MIATPVHAVLPGSDVHERNICSSLDKLVATLLPAQKHYRVFSSHARFSKLNMARCVLPPAAVQTSHVQLSCKMQLDEKGSLSDVLKKQGFRTDGKTFAGLGDGSKAMSREVAVTHLAGANMQFLTSLVRVLRANATRTENWRVATNALLVLDKIKPVCCSLTSPCFACPPQQMH